MAKIKFNGGNLALLCEYCYTIVATGRDIPSHYVTNPSENEHIFCSEECKAKYLKKIESQCVVIGLHKA